MWDLSSAGRASALQAGGHRFEPCRSHLITNLIIYGEIAQLARAHGSYPWCRGFESPSRYDRKKNPNGFFFCRLEDVGFGSNRKTPRVWCRGASTPQWGVVCEWTESKTRPNPPLAYKQKVPFRALSVLSIVIV